MPESDCIIIFTGHERIAVMPPGSGLVRNSSKAIKKGSKTGIHAI
jgi:hypothetical protein